MLAVCSALMLARMCVASRNPMMSTAPITRVSAVPRPAVMSWRRRRSVPARVIPRSPVLLGQLETYPGPDRYLDGGAVDQRRRVTPVLHGIDGRLVEHSRGRCLDYVDIARLAAGIDRVLESHAAGDALRHRRRGVLRCRAPQTLQTRGGRGGVVEPLGIRSGELLYGEHLLRIRTPALRQREIGVAGLAGEYRGPGALQELARELTAHISQGSIARIARLQLPEVPGGTFLRRIRQPPVTQRHARQLQRPIGFGLGGFLARADQFALERRDFGCLHPQAARLVEPTLFVGVVLRYGCFARLLQIGRGQGVNGALGVGIGQ